MEFKALFWEHAEDNVKCLLCPHQCVLSPGKKGICRARANLDNELYTLNYGEVTALALDPIEKKPLYHFKPGSIILSVSTYGCNMKCKFCQNYELSQQDPLYRYLSPAELVDLTINYKNNIGLAFTYNEPFIWYEYILDCAKILKERAPQKVIVLITNGYINPEPLDQMLPYIDAMNIDVKAFSNRFYRTICKAALEPVLKTIEMAYRSCFIEVTNLMITGENDDFSDITAIAKFLANLSKDIPLHISRYFPTYQMTNPPTPVNTLKEAQNKAREFLNYVYVGNVPNEDRNTYCPQCGTLVIDRNYHLYHHHCPKCGEKIAVVV